MIKDSFEGKIIRVDGLEKENLFCKIFYNNKLKEEFSPNTQQKSVLLSGQGQFTFTFVSGDVVKSVTLRLSLFNDDGAQWVPLFDSSQLIESLPEDTVSPRFLIVLCKSKTLHIIEESGEVSEDSSLNVSESEDHPNTRVDTENLIFNTQEFLESVESEILDQSSIHEDNAEDLPLGPNNEKLSRIWEKEISATSEIYEKSSLELFREESSIKPYDELLFKYKSLLKTTEESSKKTLEYEEKLLKLIENFKDQTKRSQDREESLLQLITEKETEVKKAEDEIQTLRSLKQRLEAENLRLLDTNQGLARQLDIITPSSLLPEVQRLRNLVNELQKKSEFTEKIEEYEAKLYEKETIINTLQRSIIRKPSDSDTKESQNLSISLIDELDEAVKSHSKVLNLPEPLIKDKEQMYIYGNRKLSLILINGSLMCRIGGTFKPFKEYMENFVLDLPAVKQIKKRFNLEHGLDSEYDAENFKEALNRSLKVGKTKQNVKKKTLMYK